MSRDTSSASASARRRRCTRLVAVLSVFALAWSMQPPDVAHAQLLGTLNSGPQPQSSEFLLHAPPDKIQAIAARHGLTVVRTLDVPRNDVFLARSATATTSGTTTDITLDQQVSEIATDPEVAHVEVNAVASAPEVYRTSDWISRRFRSRCPECANDHQFGGTPVWSQYAYQAATNAIDLDDARSATGAGVIVAIIDTGVDPHHPVLAPSLATGYDFINDVEGPGSEWTDVDPALRQSSTSRRCRFSMEWARLR